jgi:ribose-phosphate pyrophosphokinase
MRVLALPGASALAAALAGHLRCGHAELELHRFPDGEVSVRIPGTVRGHRVVIAGSLDQPEAKTLPLLFAADAARELGASNVGLAAPYLAYMRQDKRFRRGDAVTSRSYARLLSQSLDFLVTVDPHLHRWKTLGEIYGIPAVAVSSAPSIAAWLKDEVEHPLLLGPDSESAQWVSDVAARLGAPWAVMAKRRAGDRDVTVALPKLPRGWRDCTPVLLDDIVSTGATLLAAAAALAAAGARPPTCVAVHALAGGPAARRLHEVGIARFVSCDTVPHPSNAISLAAALAGAVQAAYQAG